MTGRIFFDTNILVYAHSDLEKDKQEVAARLIQSQSEIFISTQVVQEFVNVFISKLKIEIETVELLCSDLETNFQIFTNDFRTIQKALDVKKRYEFSIWDSLIIAAAIQSGCSILLSEDLQHQQKIDGLTIQNPFFSSETVLS
jgi:predicted nucleic acid-binding protein